MSNMRWKEFFTSVGVTEVPSAQVMPDFNVKVTELAEASHDLARYPSRLLSAPRYRSVAYEGLIRLLVVLSAAV
jgi:hypothetical protein